METLTNKKDSWSAWIFFATTLVVVSMLLTGCGDDKKSRGTTVATAPGDRYGNHPACSDCGSYTDLLTTAANASMDDAVDLALALYSPSANNETQYSGAVDAGGYMQVYQNNISECPFKTGFWRIRVGQPNGQFGSNQQTTFNLSDLTLEAVHDDGRVAQLYIPYMEFQDAQPVEGDDGNMYHNTLYGELWVTSVDGVACGWGQTPRKIFFTIRP